MNLIDVVPRAVYRDAIMWLPISRNHCLSLAMILSRGTRFKRFKRFVLRQEPEVFELRASSDGLFDIEVYYAERWRPTVAHPAFQEIWDLVANGQISGELIECVPLELPQATPLFSVRV